MIYAVDKYIDVIRQKAERETVPGFNGRDPKYHYFDTEEAALSFMVKRADEECAKAEKAMHRAKARVTKCYRKLNESIRDAANRSTE